MLTVSTENSSLLHIGLFLGKIAEKLIDCRRDSKKKSLPGQTCKILGLIYRVNFRFVVFFGLKTGPIRKVMVKTAKNSKNDPTKAFLM
jgi:hypothetical protein